MVSPVVGSANFFLSYRPGGSRCDAGLQSELIIACRNCAAAGRVHIIQLARGPRSLARAPPRVKIVRGGPPAPLSSRRSSFDMHAVPCPTSLTHSCRASRGILSRPLSDRPVAPLPPFLSSREFRRCEANEAASERRKSPLSAREMLIFVDLEREIWGNGFEEISVEISV